MSARYYVLIVIWAIIAIVCTAMFVQAWHDDKRGITRERDDAPEGY
jgi:C4-dicarboxylate transporter